MNPAAPVKIPVSAVLITRDAERHLERVLAPLSCCAEILILDSGSRDRTREIAAAHGARWHEHPFEGYGPAKRRAVTLAAFDWVLSIDADEVLDERSAAALAGVDWAAADPRTCWKLRRRPFIGSREIRHGDWAPDRVVRVFNRRHHEVSADPVHESVRPTGPVRRLDGSLLHFTAVDLAAVFRPDYYRLKAAACRAARPASVRADARPAGGLRLPAQLPAARRLPRRERRGGGGSGGGGQRGHRARARR